MSEAAKLVIAALFALNQYLPDANGDKSRPQKLVHDIQKLSEPGREAEMEAIIFSAANYSCRYITEVFLLEVAEEDDINNIEDKDLQAALEFLGSSDQMQRLADSFKNSSQYQRAQKAGIDPSEMSDIFAKICDKNFVPGQFSMADAAAVRVFINEKIKILDEDKLASLGNFRLFGSSPVYDRGGVQVATIDTDGRKWVSFREVPDNILLALLATEDLDFFNHEGIDATGLARIGGHVGLGKDNIAGGSTITMQLLKNLYFGELSEPEGSIFNGSDLSKVLRKAREIYWAKPYEEFHGGGRKGKEYVLEQYLNLVTYGPGIQGIAQAASTFFAKDVAEVTKGEAAFLVSLLKNPLVYSNPRYFHTPRGTSQRVTGYILDRMLKNGMFNDKNGELNQTEFEDAMAFHLPDANYEKPKRGLLSEAFVFVNNQARSWVRRAQVFFGKPVEIQVDTSLNSELQQVVFDSTRKILDRHDSKKARKGLSRVGPALDSTGAVASVLFKDISSADLRDLKGAVADLNTLTDSIYMSALFLGEVTRGSKTLYFSETYKDWPAPLKQDLNQKLSSYFKYVGQAALISIAAQEECLPELNELDITATIAAKKSYIPESTECIEIVSGPTSYVSKTELIRFNNFSEQLREQLISSTLARVGTGRSREEHIPAMYDGWSESGYPLVFADGSRPKMSEKHIKHIDKLLSRAEEPLKRGNVLWLKGNGKEKKGPGPNDFCDQNVKTNCHRMIRPRLKPSPEEITSLLEEKKEETDNPELLPEVFEDGVYDLRSPEKRRAAELNPKVEKIADSSSEFELTPPMLQAAVLIMDSHTGEILANFGGYNPSTSVFDRSRMAFRQPGSTLKPWIYYLAMHKGVLPFQRLRDGGVFFDLGGGREWPKKEKRGVPGTFTGFYQGLVGSRNQATLSLVQEKAWNGGDWEQNLKEMCQFFKDINIYKDKDFECVVSAMLGSGVLSIRDLVSSYSFFSNGQHIVKPQLIKNVKDGYGNSYFESEVEKVPVPFTSFESLFHIRNMMIQVNNRGTAKRLNTFLSEFGGRDGERPFKQCFDRSTGYSSQTCFGGKTGTTNDATNTWYVGYSNRYVIGVWVGYDQPEEIQGASTGASVAFPIFEQILFSGYHLLPKVDSLLGNQSVPEGMEIVKVLQPSDGPACVPSSNNGIPQSAFTPTLVSKGSNNFRGCHVCECRKQANYYDARDTDYVIWQRQTNTYGGDRLFYWEDYNVFDQLSSRKPNPDLIECLEAVLRYSRDGDCANDPKRVEEILEQYK